MNKTKLSLFLLVPVLSSGAIIGCNSRGGSSSDVISISIVSDNAEYTTMNTFIKKYKEIPGNENKKFKVVKMTNYNDYIFNSFLYDELTDIIQVYDYNAEYYTNADLDGAGTSLLQSVTPFMQKDGINESDFFDSIIEMTKCKTGSDEMYWVPRDYNKVVCAYNKKIFDIAGVDYPTDDWTWSEFVATCEALKAKQAEIRDQYSHSATFFSVDMNLDFPAVYYPILKSFGAELIDKETRTCFGNSNEKVEIAKSAWGKLLSLVDNKLASEPGGQQIGFTNKQAAMMFIVRPNLPTYVKGLGEDAVDFVSLPTYDDLPSGSKSYIGMGCTGYGMTTSCPDKKKEQVWDFLKFIISEQGQNAFSEAGSGIPCLKRLANDENAVFKQYLVNENNHPNHDAFVAHPERDIPMNIYKGFEVSKQLTIDKYIKDRTLSAFFTASDRDQYYQEYKRDMEKIWSK